MRNTAATAETCETAAKDGPGRPVAGSNPAKRQQIIDGARRVFIEKGFDAASMNDVTRAAGVSKGTVYVYFASKEDLFEALIEEEREKIFQDLFTPLRRPDKLYDTLINLGKRLSTKITLPKVVLAQRTVIGASERIPELGARFYERGPLNGHGQLVAFLKEAEAEGLLSMPDANLAAYQFSELCLAGYYRQCLFAYRTEPPTPEEIDGTVRSGVDMFLKTYGTAKLRQLESDRPES